MIGGNPHQGSGRVPIVGPGPLYRPFVFIPLFTGVRGRGILRSSFAGSCIERPLRGARMASEATPATEEGTTCCGGA